jgi:hypothetical protein
MARHLVVTQVHSITLKNNFFIQETVPFRVSLFVFYYRLEGLNVSFFTIEFIFFNSKPKKEGN